MINRTEEEITRNWPKDSDAPLVTVLAISYCHEKYIHTALDSILAQETSFPFEVIVHDDASPDNSAAIIEEYAKKYPNIIRPVLEDENQFSKGVQAILHVLLPLIRGKYIAFIDCDDYWTDVKKLHTQVSYLEAHPAFLAVAHNCTMVDIDGIPTGQQYPECRDEEFTTEHFFNDILAGQFGTLMIRDFLTQATDDHPFIMNAPPGPFDRVLNLTLLLNGRVHCIQKSMSAYRYITHSGTSFSATFHYDIKRDARFYLSFVLYCKRMGRIGDAIGMLQWFIGYTEGQMSQRFVSPQDAEPILSYCRTSISSLIDRLLQRHDAFARLAVYIQQLDDSYYTEEKCEYRSVTIDKQYSCTVSLSDFGEITSLRIDPMQNPCCLRQVSVSLFTVSGDKITAPVMRTNAQSFRDALIFDNDDPQIELCIPKGKYKSVSFTSELIACDPEEINYLKEAAEIEAKLIYSESEKDELTEQLTTTRKELTEQLAVTRHELDSISNSTFWKITKPARTILDASKNRLNLFRDIFHK